MTYPPYSGVPVRPPKSPKSAPAEPQDIPH